MFFILGLLGLGFGAYFVTRAVVGHPNLIGPADPPIETSPRTEITATRTPARQERQSFIVCLDPGHPSEVSDGMHKLNGLRETEVNWDVSLRIKLILENARVKVVMTKSKMEEKVMNKQRSNIANNARADLMIRIHADAGGGTGFTIYYPRKQGTKDGVTGPSQAVMQASAKAAQHMHAAMSESLKGKLKDNGIRGDEQSYVGARQGAFTGSIYSKVPVLLVEMCFLDNISDANWIRIEGNKNLMAHAIAKGAISYLRNK